MAAGKPHGSRKTSKKSSTKKGTKNRGVKTQGKVCGRRVKNCECGHRYPASEYSLEVCPECGRSRFCTQDILCPNGACWIHGGNTPSGPASANFKHGGYSQAWENIGLKQYHDGTRDVDLLDASEAMRSLQARIWYVLEQGQGGALYRQMQAAWKTLKERGRAGDKAGQTAAAAHLDSLMQQGSDEADRWDEYYKLEEQLDRMRDRAHKRMVDGELLIKIDLVIRIIGIFIFAVKAILKKELETVGHPDVARSISGGVDREFKRLFGGFDTSSVERRGGQEADRGDSDPGSGVD
jgi:hypothetical protein